MDMPLNLNLLASASAQINTNMRKKQKKGDSNINQVLPKAGRCCFEVLYRLFTPCHPSPQKFTG
jgi:hypothetical protein